MIAALVSIAWFMTVDAPIKCELIQPFDCRKLAEGIIQLELRRQFCPTPPNAVPGCPPLSEAELAALRKLEEWWEQAKCRGDHT